MNQLIRNILSLVIENGEIEVCVNVTIDCPFCGTIHQVCKRINIFCN
jgi:hypothetical protein